MNDRRRINGPTGATRPPVFSKLPHGDTPGSIYRPTRSRPEQTLRKMFLKTGVTPSASGSAYLELESSFASSTPSNSTFQSLIPSGLKLTCTVHGPRPLPRSAPFSPNVVLTTHIKYAPFATRQRRGYIRDAIEKDLSLHLETALRGVIIGDRWPKSGVEVIITILEGEEDKWWGDEHSVNSEGKGKATVQWGIMGVLSGCITVASAAIADAGIDCVDMVAGGVAALVQNEQERSPGSSDQTLPTLVLDPSPVEHFDVLAACVVAYLPARDEITDIWMKGDLDRIQSGIQSGKSLSHEVLIDEAIYAAIGSHRVLASAVRESAGLRLKNSEF